MVRTSDKRQVQQRIAELKQTKPRAAQKTAKADYKEAKAAYRETKNAVKQAKENAKMEVKKILVKPVRQPISLKKLKKLKTLRERLKKKRKSSRRLRRMLKNTILQKHSELVAGPRQAFVNPPDMALKVRLVRTIP